MGFQHECGPVGDSEKHGRGCDMGHRFRGLDAAFGGSPVVTDACLRACFAKRIFQVTVICGHVFFSNKGVRHCGARRESFVPGCRSRGKEIHSLLALEARQEFSFIYVCFWSAEPGRRFGRALLVIHACQEGDSSGRIGLIECTQRGCLPLTVCLFDAWPRDTAHGWDQLEARRRVELVEQFHKVAGAELPAPGSPRAKVVRHGWVGGCRGGVAGSEEHRHRAHHLGLGQGHRYKI